MARKTNVLNSRGNWGNWGQLVIRDWKIQSGSGLNKSSHCRNREIRTVLYCEAFQFFCAIEDPVLLGGHRVEEAIVEAWTICDIERVTDPESKK
jgi:hypothetical protein